MGTKELLKNKVILDGQQQSLTNVGLATFLNPYSYLFFRKNHSLFSKFDVLYIDGILLVRLLGIFGVKVKRTSFDMTSLAPEVFKESIKRKQSIYFIGSTEEAMNDFISVLAKSWPSLNIVGFRNGYFVNNRERDEAIQAILELNPEIIVVGMGTPYQEQFLLDLKTSGYKGAGYTCGGFIHQTTEKVEYYPEFFNKYHLRWLYRIYDEPKLFQRYMFYYPKSVFMFFLDFLAVQKGKGKP